MILIFTIITLAGSVSQAPAIEYIGMAIIQGNTLMSVSVPSFIRPMVNADLIGCLEKYESNGNPKAYNPKDTDGRPKYGILQFDAGTFKYFCVDKYKMPNDIWDVDVQERCADRIIQEGGIGNWPTTKNYCK